jgi:hypothetical protein
MFVLRYKKRFIIVVISALQVILLSQCTVVRVGTAGWEQSVRPALICPEDEVTVQWSLADPGGCLGEGCPDPPSVNITSAPNLFAAGDFPTGDLVGTRIVQPQQDTHFTLDATYEGRALTQYEYDVQLILPERVHSIPATFNGTCEGTRPTWNPIIPHGDTSERVQLVRICNTSSDTVTFGFESGTRLALGPGDCEDISEKPGNWIWVTDAPSAVLAANCFAHFKTEPEDISTELVLACTSE